ncbi:hypothetical protein CAPTEDRAFT_196928 [Capitella teleta]|uniref:Beta-lactamase-related domain-containing protein n=1 Tax=Capitella teleta TaxID=283909 RepID=R7US60_CAPTE|nr:hypothetical protein CAPTEDRAFT_196928 [Capitella teleta]|eukprot:ELU06236.1 hypothetical protein CAPTEDRAFT_196928 [Capitella teleta]
MKVLILCLLFVLGSALTPEQELRIQEFMDDFLQCSEVPGLSLGIVRNGIQELAAGYGVADLDTLEPVNGRTLFNIASTSKAFATVLLAKQLSLNEQRLRFLQPVFPPRTTFQYTNTMYTLTGIVSEQLAGGWVSWEDLIEQEFFYPLGMYDSTFVYRTLPEMTGHASPYERVDGVLQKTPWQMYLGLEAFNPAAGISSNAEDMNKWMNFLLGHGPIDNSYVSQTFEPELVSSNTPYFSKPTAPVTMEATNYYARAWYAGHYRGYKTHSHGGDLRGHHTYVYIMPELDIGIFHTFNFQTAKKQREMVSAFVVDVLLGEEPWFTGFDVCAAGRSEDLDDDVNDPLRTSPAGEVFTVKDLKKSVSVRTDDYIGMYGNFYYANVTISTEYFEGETFLRLQFGEGDYLLGGLGGESFYMIGHNELSSRINLGTMSFERDVYNQVTSLTLPGFESLDPPVFVKGRRMDEAPFPDLHSCN